MSNLLSNYKRIAEKCIIKTNLLTNFDSLFNNFNNPLTFLKISIKLQAAMSKSRYKPLIYAEIGVGLDPNLSLIHLC